MWGKRDIFVSGKRIPDNFISAMRIFTLLFLTIFFNAPSIFAQNGHVKLLLQSPDGKNVRLLWLLKGSGMNITGYDIKRKEGLQDWVKLNTEPIVPGVSMKRNFVALGANKNEENILKARLYKLLASHKLKETDAQYLQKLGSDEKTLQELTNTIAADHELALMHGLAYLDHTISKRTDYQYGIFVQGTNTLLAKATWNYGEIPDLNTIREITSKATPGKPGVAVTWNADLNKMKAGNVAGFNIYRQGIRLNTDPIGTTNVNDASEFSWTDKSANSASPIQYSISAVSIFGIEGIIKSYTYSPEDHPGQYKKAEVSEVNSMGYYFKDGISIKWNFPKEYERFIKGFYVEKDNMPNGYSRVSTLQEPTARMFVDKTPSPTSVYIRFRIVAVYADRTMEPGIERLYSYFPITEPPRPFNLKGDIPATNKKTIISLSWASKIAGDSATDHYRVYSNESGADNFIALNEDRSLVVSKFVYRVPDGLARTYKFFVTALNRSGGESNPSDTISIQVPSTALPAPVITRATADSNKVTIQWQYPEVSDLRGFVLYQNNKAIADDLKKNDRQYIVAKPDAGTNAYTIRALSESGVMSEYSSPVTVAMPEGTK